ncbi:uncharacterized protein LOC119528586 [Choloepus didactylus]|uniref:uncharacterized protein LOC119528586 n=1 Tax=Choloepus didactylus TaxID=27675 RepID=UPI00189CA6A2|nr:uncharacterized protein LOC119528586 [Choloepus didactylus]
MSGPALFHAIEWYPYQHVNRRDRKPRSVKSWLWNLGGIVASVFVPAVGNAVLQAWTTEQIALTMETVNALANATRDALHAHNLMLELNSQAIQKMQSEIQELGQEIDGLWKTVVQLCDTRWILFRLCVTPVRANVTANTHKVSDWLKNTYLPTFANLTQQVDVSLDKIGNVKLTPVKFNLASLVTDLWNRVTSWFSWPNLTTWVFLAVGLLVGLVIVKCLLERLFQAQQQLRVTTMMAMSSTCSTFDSSFYTDRSPSRPLGVGRSGARFAAKSMAVSRI